MTINKAQGQTLDTVGVNLQQPVFSHGQLYVALSRATTAARIKVILNAFYDGKEEPTSAKNIVYREILSEAHSNPKAGDLNLATVSRILLISKCLPSTVSTLSKIERLDIKFMFALDDLMANHLRV